MKRPRRKQKERSHRLFLIAGGVTVVLAGVLVFDWLLKHRRAEPAALAEQYVARPAGSLTFSKDIAPIIYGHCAVCHHPGDAAPFPLLTYDDVAKRAKQIVDVTQRRYMPPWLPEPGYVEFLEPRILTVDQIGLIQQWVTEGAPEGDARDLPAPPKFAEGWKLGQPDLVVSMPQPYTLAAAGADVYRNFVLPIPLSERRYVRAVEFNPGNRQVVHHAFIKFDPTSGSRRLDAEDAQPGFSGLHTPVNVMSPEGFFPSWQPGKRPSTSPPGLAWLLETNTDLVLQAHLQPSGKPEQLQASVAFYFAEAAPTNTPFKIALTSYDIDIPAGATNYQVTDSYVLPVDVEALGILPHAHFLARELKGVATLPSGSNKWLLFIRNWDFNWQGDYRFANPIFLPRGTTVSMAYSYDNSTNNIRNPHQPPARVRYGPQSMDEMAELWIQVLPRDQVDLQKLVQNYQSKALQNSISYNRYLLLQNPQDAKAHGGVGKALLLLGRTDEASTHLQTAVKIEPTDAETHYYLGLLSRLQRKLGEARKEFQTTIQLNPEHAKAHGNLGLILLELGEYTNAETYLRNALRLNPNDTVAKQSLEDLSKVRAEARQ